MKKDQISYRGYLEVQRPDGTAEFVETNRILRSPDLQECCLEKRVLRGIIAKLRRHGLLASLNQQGH